MKQVRFNPIKWARNMTFVALLALDFQHTYEFILSLSNNAQSHEPVPLFGTILGSIGIPMTNGVFDALAYAFMVTATIYFMSNTLAKRLSHNHPSTLYVVAMMTAVGLSVLTNAGTMYYGAEGSLIIPTIAIGWVAAGLGGVITAGLLMFASMDAWDMKARVEKATKTREKNRAKRDQDELTQKRKSKYTPHKYKGEDSQPFAVTSK